MEITFEILKEACGCNGQDWKDSDNCNHRNFTFSGELDADGYDEGYVIRSNQPCAHESCPFLCGT